MDGFYSMIGQMIRADFHFKIYFQQIKSTTKPMVETDKVKKLKIKIEIIRHSV